MDSAMPQSGAYKYSEFIKKWNELSNYSEIEKPRMEVLKAFVDKLIS